MRRAISAGVLILVVFTAVPALSQGMGATLMNEFKAHLKEDAVAQPNTVYDRVLELKELIIDLQNEGPLLIENLALCNSVDGFSMVEPYAGNSVRTGDTLLVYYEPVNWFIRRDSGSYDVHLIQDLRVENEQGQAIFQEAGLLEFALDTERPVFDLYMTNTFNLGPTPPGRYTYIITLRDVYKGTSVDKEFEFVITP